MTPAEQYVERTEATYKETMQRVLQALKEREAKRPWWKRLFRRVFHHLHD